MQISSLGFGNRSARLLNPTYSRNLMNERGIQSIEKDIGRRRRRRRASCPCYRRRNQRRSYVTFVTFVTANVSDSSSCRVHCSLLSTFWVDVRGKCNIRPIIQVNGHPAICSVDIYISINYCYYN